jgi:hypothetical protein
VAGTAVAACASTPAASADRKAAAPPTELTYTLDTETMEYHPIDIGKKGDSAGDRHISAFTVLADGQPTGRAHSDCLAVDNAYEGQMCAMVVMLPGGTISFQNAGLHKPLGDADTSGERFAVTGGTGVYSGARGEMTVGEAEDGPITITLLP